MALFKIEKGQSTNLTKNRPNTVEGYCYFTTDDGKFYIDTGTGTGTSKRVCLNAAKADKADKLSTARTITLSGDVSGSASFDGSKNVTITATVVDDSHNHTLTASAEDDGVIKLTGTNGINQVSYKAEHTTSLKSKYSSSNATTSIKGSGASGTIKIPQISVNTYGHVTAAADESIEITMPTIPSLSGGSAAANDATVVGGVTVNGHAVSVGKKTLTAGSNVTITGGTDAVTIAATDKYHTRAYSSGLQISTGTGVSNMYVPEGTTSKLGVVKQHKAADCTVYSSDEGATTPAAVKQAFSLFGAKNGIFYVAGNTTGTAGTWTGENKDIPSLFSGLTIAYKIGIAGGSSTTTLSLTTAAGTSDAIAIKRNNSNLTTHLPVNTVVILTYDGTYWRWADYDSNTNTQLRVYRQDASGYNADYPLLASRTLAKNLGTVGTEGSNTAVYGLISDTNENIPTTNPYTGETKVKKLTIANSVLLSNASDTQGGAPSLKWKTYKENTPYIGYATDQSDGTFILASLKGTIYSTGLAIGGGSGNLLWKGSKVISVADISNKAATLNWDTTSTVATIGGTDITVKLPANAPRTPYLETWNTGKTATYEANYPLYAWWETSSICKLVVDNYTTKVDLAVKLAAPVTIQTDLASTATASFDGSANVTVGITGTLAIGHGGTGITSNPSMLINLGSTTAASVFAANPRPGITGILAIGHGGTGASTAINARYNLLYVAPPVTTTTNDTTTTWGALGPATISFYSTLNQLTDQPSQYGLLLNYNNKGNEVHQLWLTQASGDILHRGGNANGWNGTWRKILDSINFNSYAPTLTGTGASGTWGISITGNAATATTAETCTGNAATATLATNAKNVRITLTNPTSAKTYYPTWVTGTDSETNYALRDNDGFKYLCLEGTADANGYGYVIAGNAVASGTAGNKYGGLRLFGTGTTYTNLRTYQPTTSRTAYLRDYGATAYLVSTTTTSAVGNLRLPVYINASGVAKACTMGASGNWFNVLTYVMSDGVMETGKYIDFHLTDTATTDNDFRLTCESSGVLKCSGKLYGAVWNDYAEYRKYKDGDEIPYGRIVIENGDDTLSLSTRRLQKGGNVCSDTFGFAIGETEETKMPIAVSGRALVYTYEDRNSYEPGDAVCTGPNGTISKMTREEIKEYPDCIIGYVSAIPNYETWGEDNTLVNGRIWIKVQ